MLYKKFRVVVDLGLLLRTPYSVVSAFLALFISALILVSFAYSVHAIYAQMGNIAESVDYEVVMLIENTSRRYVLNESVRIQSIADIVADHAKELAETAGRLWEDDRVEDVYGLIYAVPIPGNSSNANISMYLTGDIGGVLYVVSKKPIGSCVNRPTTNAEFWDLLRKIAADAGVQGSCSGDIIETVDDYVSRLSYISISRTSGGPFGISVETTTRFTGLPPSADAVFIVTSDSTIFVNAVMALMGGLNASGVEISPGAVAVALRPESYVNPASAQATIENLHKVADDLGKEAGAAVVSTYRADMKISDYQTFENIARLMIVFGLIPPILIVLIATNPIAESIILSMRKQVGLLRLRGAGPGMLKKEFLITTAVTGVIGFAAGAALTLIAAYAVFGESGHAVAVTTLSDPVIIAIAAVLTGIVLGYTARKARRIIAELSPSEAIKTTLTPEELLKPLKVGGLGWFSIIVGLYFVITGYIGWSASSALLNYMAGASGTPNIGLLIVLIILAMIEGVLKPFAPILLAYGIAKYVAVNYDKIMERVARSGVLGEFTFVGKGLIGVMRRRVTAILVLTIFTVSVLAQTYIATTANETLMSSAMVTSVGNKYGAFLDLRMNSSEGIREITQYLGGLGCGAYIGVQSMLGPDPEIITAMLVIVPDPEILLSNTAWFPDWSRPDPFDVAIRRIGDSDVMFLSKEATGIGSKRFGIGNTTTLRSWITNASINVTIAEKTDGFPGYGLLSASLPQGMPTISPTHGSYNVVIAGPEMASRLEEAGFLEPGSRIRLVVMSDDNATLASCVESIKEASSRLGMKPVGEAYVSVDDLKITDIIIGGSLTMAQSMLSITQAVILMGLAVAFSVILSWSVTKEVIRVYLLLRVRGASAKDIAKVGAVKWGSLAAVAIALGLFVGGALGRGNIAASSLGLSLIPLTATTSTGLTVPVNLGQGVMNPYMPLEGWAIVGITMAALTLFPLAITLRVFRGAVRERFIEVR